MLLHFGKIRNLLAPKIFRQIICMYSLVKISVAELSRISRKRNLELQNQFCEIRGAKFGKILTPKIYQIGPFPAQFHDFFREIICNKANL